MSALVFPGFVPRFLIFQKINSAQLLAPDYFFEKLKKMEKLKHSHGKGAHTLKINICLRSSFAFGNLLFL